MIIIGQWNQTVRLYEIQVICSCRLMSECRVKMVICKTRTVTLANSADPDQTPQNAASDQGPYCLLKLQQVKG